MKEVKGLQKVHEEVLVEPEEQASDSDDQLVDDELIKDLEANYNLPCNVSVY